MICLSLGFKKIGKMIRAIKPGGFYEVRLDMLDRTELKRENLTTVFKSDARLIATFRPGKGMSGTVRRKVLEQAIMAGAAFVDIESDSSKSHLRDLVSLARERNCRVIVSHHDYQGTRQLDELLGTIKRCRKAGRDLVKIACKVNDNGEICRLLSLLEGRPYLIVTGMGPMGGFIRAVSLVLGAPFNYAAPDSGPLTAPGQVRGSKLALMVKELDGMKR